MATMLSGKQEHYLKRELISQQAKYEISELSSPTALQRFGAPFRSEYGEVSPMNSDLPILRYIFCNHVRNFPFLDKAKEQEFWQDKLQVFLESFAGKQISSSEDRLEETKRRKLALKAQKLVELMMVSGIPTASGYEERIRFSEMELVDREASDQGLLVNSPEGAMINGWEVNVAGVRTISVKRTVRYHQHAEFIIRVKRADGHEWYVGRRYGQFSKLHKRVRMELPGRILPPLPRKNRSSTHSVFSWNTSDDEISSISSTSTRDLGSYDDNNYVIRSSLQPPTPKTHRRSRSRNSIKSSPRASIERLSYEKSSRSARTSMDRSPIPRSERPLESIILFREEQRVSLRAFLRTFLQNSRIAESKAVEEFLTAEQITLNQEEDEDLRHRKLMDEKRLQQQEKFYELARERAQELDIYMEKFRREIVESNGLRRLFQEIREKNCIAELSDDYKKFAEWLKIEVAATIYHVFFAEDNSPELFAQAKRIHAMMPYAVFKNILQWTNPTLVISAAMDFFLASPFGARSLMQRVLGMSLNDGIRQMQRLIDNLVARIDDIILCQKLKHYVESDESLKVVMREEASADDVDIVVTILRSEYLEPELTSEQVERIFNAYVAWNNAVDDVDLEMKKGVQLFADLKQLLKLYTRQRDKKMMISIIEEPVTLKLFRDLFSIFYEPLIRVYKSAKVYDCVTDFALFASDAIDVIEQAQRQDFSADPNQTVQAFIDLCTRHEDDFFKFVHQVHTHDNGLFDQLMGWIEGILEFLRNGPKGGKLDMNALFQGAVNSGEISKDRALEEIDALIKWQQERKRWHHNKTRQKMAAQGDQPGALTFKSSDFGLDDGDLEDLTLDDDSSDEETEVEELDDLTAERKRRLRGRAGEPQKPEIEELTKLKPSFLAMLRRVLAE